MKNLLLLVLATTFSCSVFAGDKDHQKKFTMKIGKFRQVFYSPQAYPAAGVHQLDTIVDNLKFGISLKCCITITGDREGDAFKIRANLLDSAKTLIMQQIFFMDGTRSDERSKDSWFISDNKGELKQFFKECFGIEIKSRRQFIKDKRIADALKASDWEAFLLDKKLDN